MMRVKRNLAAGKAKDAIYFLGTLFYEDDIITRLRSKFDNVGEALRIYYEFKEKHKDHAWPDEIKPFVYTDNEAGTLNFLIHYLDMHFNFASGTEEDVLALLSNHELMHRQFLEMTFPKATNTVISDLMRKGTASTHAVGVFKELPYQTEIKAHISLMLSNFSYYHKVLLEAYKTAYRFVDELHTTDEARHIFEKITALIKDPSYDIVERFRNIFKLPDSVYSFPFYFTLLNPYRLHYSNHGPQQICFGLGLHFRDEIESQYHMKHVTLKSYCKIMGCDLRFKVVELFSKYQTLCATDIAHYLNARKAAVYVHINALLSNDMIVYANPDKKNVKGVRIYFRANPEYFKVIREDTRRLCYNLENVHHAGVEKYALPKRKKRSDDQDFEEEVDEG